MQLHRSGWVVKRAGSGNRTRMASLEGWSFAIKLYPRSSGMNTNTRRAYMQAIFLMLTFIFHTNRKMPVAPLFWHNYSRLRTKKIGFSVIILFTA